MHCMKSETALNIGAKLMFFNGLFVCAYGFLVMVFTRMLVEEHVSRIGILLVSLEAENPAIINIMMTFLRIAGVAGVAVGIMVMYFSSFCLKYAKDGRKSSWWVWLLTGSLGWGGLIFLESFLWTPVTMTFAVIGAAMFILSVIIPAKAVFSS